MDEKETILKEYSKLISAYQDFTNQLKSLIEKALSKNKIKYHVVEARTKTEESLKNKLDRKGNLYEAHLNNVPDLTGIRIILYYPDQIDLVKQIMLKIFNVDEVVDKRQLMDTDQFGYLSVHLEVSLNEKRKKLIEWQDFALFRAEIQIRSILQHAWAMVSHSLIYKRESEAPLMMHRKLNQLAGLFEIADEYFMTIRDMESNISKEISEAISEKRIDVSIDLVSLSRFLTQEKTIKYLSNLGKKSDVVIGADSHEQCYRDLYYAIKMAEIKTISELEKNLNFSSKKVKNYFGHINELGHVISYCLAEFLALLIIGFKVPNLNREHLIAIGKSDEEIEKILIVVK